MSTEQAKKLVIIGLIFSLMLKAYVDFQQNRMLPWPANFLRIAVAFMLIGLLAEFVPTVAGVLTIGIILAALVTRGNPIANAFYGVAKVPPPQ